MCLYIYLLIRSFCFFVFIHLFIHVFIHLIIYLPLCTDVFIYV